MARAFLYRTARNLIIDHSRKKQSLSLDALFDEENPSYQDVPDHSMIPSGSLMDQKLVIEKLKELPDQHFDDTHPSLYSRAHHSRDCKDLQGIRKHYLCTHPSSYQTCSKTFP
jgi:hypothetical protein